jgi:hypothetical protein
VSQGLPDDLARVHARAIDGAAEQLLEGNQTVTRIEIETAEDLEGSISELRNQKARGLPRRVQRPTGAQFGGVVTSGEFERGGQPSGRSVAVTLRQRANHGF